MKLALLIAVIAAATVICIPLDTRRVRHGWVPKRFTGSHAEYVAAYRRQLALAGWSFVTIGAMYLAPVVWSLATSDSDYVHDAVKGTSFGATGVVSLMCRRSLNRRSDATALRHPQSDTAQRK